MTQSNFTYLENEFPILFNLGQSAELNLHEDPVVSLLKLRQFVERLTEYLFEEHHIEFPYDNTIHTRLKTLEFESLLPPNIKDLLFNIKSKGNKAIHEGKGTAVEATGVLLSSFKVAKWFYDTYSEEQIDTSQLKFHKPDNLDSRHALHELTQQYDELQKKFNELLKERDTSGLPAEEKQAIAEKSQQAARKIDMSEEETRDIIDQQLSDAGWEVDTNNLNYKLRGTLPQAGKNMAIAEWPCDTKWADYALFIGTKLYGIVEAKKYSKDISTDLRQSKIYSELVEPKHEAQILGEWRAYKVPFLFSTNGRPYLKQIETKSGVWFLDVRNEYHYSRPLQGWYSPEGLKKLFDKDIDGAVEKLKTESPDFLKDKSGLGLRDYQLQAIQAIEDTVIQNPNRRRALIAMATGTGKTRTIIGLCYRLIQTNRFQRILFLVDRTLLGKQAMDAFVDNKIAGLNTFAEIYEVKGLKDLIPDIDTRLHFATVQGMVKRLFYNDNGEDQPSVDQYDCIIIDEAHRGYLLDREIDEDDLEFKNQHDYVSKYRMVLEYFDSFAVGLTATPALHTKEIFGSPVFTYSYREAVIDGYLIDHEPPYKIKTKLAEEGIVWVKGEKPKALDHETNALVELEELEDELRIEITGFNKLVVTDSFNRTVIQQLVKELDPDGDEKTLIFAATDEHADLVVKILKEEFEELGISVSDDAIQKITGKSYDPQEQLLRYKNEKYPNVAVTVDLLTTGIDVPAICNLVFLRRIKSRILYEQMLGRATRRCDDIGKETFQIFDAVKIYETLQDYTQMKPVVTNPSTTFQQLTDEFQHFDNETRVKKQVEQIVAKLQRKKRYLSDQQKEQFAYNTKGLEPDEFIEKLRTNPTAETVKDLVAASGLWKFLDELKPAPKVMLVSEHEDEYLGTERGYGDAEKPEDYLENFSNFIQENQNKISALNVICTKPSELDRQSLKELKIELDQHGFNSRILNSAWKAAKNEDIAADIISFIRTLAVGSSLKSHEERIRNAIQQIRGLQNWTKIQLKWIDRFEKQLLQETVLKVEDLNESPFSDAGGFNRLDKIFDNQLEDIISQINSHLYA